MAQGEANIVEAFEETELAEWVYVEGRVETVTVRDRLGFKRDCELIVRNGLCVVEEPCYLVLGEPGEDDAVLACVRKEDGGEGGSDDGAKAEVVQRPGGVFAAGAAGEVLAGDGKLRGPVARGGLIQLRVGVSR